MAPAATTKPLRRRPAASSPAAAPVRRPAGAPAGPGARKNAPTRHSWATRRDCPADRQPAMPAAGTHPGPTAPAAACRPARPPPPPGCQAPRRPPAPARHAPPASRRSTGGRRPAPGPAWPAGWPTGPPARWHGDTANAPPAPVARHPARPAACASSAAPRARRAGRRAGSAAGPTRYRARSAGWARVRSDSRPGWETIHA